MEVEDLPLRMLKLARILEYITQYSVSKIGEMA